MLPSPSAQVLAVQSRTSLGHSVKALRRTGSVPANIFGHGESVAIQVNEALLLRRHSQRRLVGVLALTLPLQAESVMVLVHKIAISPRSGKVQHVDFFRLAMNEVVHTHVPLHFIGESAIVRANQAAIIPLLESIAVTGLPGKLPTKVEVDVSQLMRLDTVLHARDIQLPPGVTLNISPDEPIAKIQTQRGEVAKPTVAPEVVATA
ncbi:MAG: 50S ribosomal protein L25 [Ktedonobacterales bacterium]|nr:50S ribosomal protein L25 [Ktedonobacterales bacterium]